MEIITEWDLENTSINVSFNTDGTKIAVISYSKVNCRSYTASKLVIWDIYSQIQFATIEMCSTDITSIIFSPNSKQIAICFRTSACEIWNIDTKSRNFISKDYITSAIAFSQDETRIFAASTDKIIRILDSQSNEPIGNLIGHTGTVNTIIVEKITAQKLYQEVLTTLLEYGMQTLVLKLQ